MLKLLPELLVGPLLVGGATQAGRRWGPQAGGVVSVLPAVVGPVLLITATQRGAASAAQAANGTLLGLIGLSGFALSYGWVALRRPWTASLVAAWASAGVLAVVVGSLAGGAGFPVGLGGAVAALVLARYAMPRPGPDPPRDPARPTSVAAQVLATGLLVALLSAAAVFGGPLVGGLLAGLPALASVLAAGTHRRAGPEAVIALLRGMLSGMAGFVGFCAVVAALIVPAGVAAAFVSAAAVAIVLQLASLTRLTPNAGRPGRLGWQTMRPEEPAPAAVRTGWPQPPSRSSASRPNGLPPRPSSPG